MKFFWMFPVVLSAFANKAIAAEASATFKIRSHVCSDLGKVRTGSAVLINTSTGDPLFVTSSHVILNFSKETPGLALISLRRTAA
ncbi:MAG: hypothetical protein NTV34_03560 [Proteobacteria bacterium]|nr:hypothetical protein [Pseudomonadota bacterium]